MSLSCMVCVKDNWYVNLLIKFYELACDQCFSDFDDQAQRYQRVRFERARSLWVSELP